MQKKKDQNVMKLLQIFLVNLIDNFNNFYSVIFKIKNFCFQVSYFPNNQE